jgi:hypothetical protein
VEDTEIIVAIMISFQFSVFSFQFLVLTQN